MERARGEALRGEAGDGKQALAEARGALAKTRGEAQGEARRRAEEQAARQARIPSGDIFSSSSVNCSGVGVEG